MGKKLQARRTLILDTLANIPICTTLHLAEITNVSTETIRKDLDALANEGLIVKVHGGAALANATSTIPFDERVVHHSKEKKRIVKGAIPLLSFDDTIILESCTTNLELSKLLLTQSDLLESLTIITNSFPITNLFEHGKKCKRLFFLGGWCNPGQHNVHGNQTIKILQNFHVGKAFLSGAALSNKYILSSFYEHDAMFQKTAIDISNETILMIDHSKFNKNALYAVTSLSDINYVITDTSLTPDDLLEMESKYHLRWITV